MGSAGQRNLADLDEYRELVSDVFSDAVMNPNVTREFENFGDGHARIVLEAMIQRAEQIINIYSKELNRVAYDARWFESFLSRSPDGKIVFIVERPDVFNAEASILSRLPQFRSHPRVTLYLAPPSAHVFHVAIVDGRFARLENSHEKFKAAVALGPSPIVTEAERLFQEVRSRSVLLS